MSFGVQAVRGLLLSLLLSAAFALTACGSDDNPDQTTTVTEGATGSTGPTGPSAVASRPEPGEAEAIALVKRFYRLLDAYRFQEAWSFVPQEVRAESGGYASWKAGYRTNVNSSPRGIAVDSLTAKRAVVSLELQATDIDACTGRRVNQVFTGAWTLAAVNDNWEPQSISLDKISGGTPALTASDCTEEPAPSQPESCDPSYDPCVPPYPPDVDCPDVGGPVTVTGSDPHELDADTDGVGCET